jgi:hypothetical protein
VREALGKAGIEPHHLEQLSHAATPARDVRLAVDRQRLGDDASDPHPRVERAERILKDDLQALARGPELARRQREKVPPFEADIPRSGLDQPQDEPAGGGLAAARLAHEAQRLARLEVEAYPIHRANHAPAAGEPRTAHVELLDEALHLEQRARRHVTTGQATKCPGSRSSSAGSSRRQLATA